jgi:hypothetical protein
MISEVIPILNKIAPDVLSMIASTFEGETPDGRTTEDPAPDGTVWKKVCFIFQIIQK